MRRLRRAPDRSRTRPRAAHTARRALHNQDDANNALVFELMHYLSESVREAVLTLPAGEDSPARLLDLARVVERDKRNLEQQLLECRSEIDKLVRMPALRRQRARAQRQRQGVAKDTRV